MYHRILVPVDGSSTAKRALQEAILLAGLTNAQVALVHIYIDIAYLVGEDCINYEELQKTVQLAGEKILTEAAQLVAQAGLMVQTKSMVATNQKIAQAIITEAEHWEADLIVIGSHGHSGFTRLLLGSVAEGVIRRSSIPVLMIRSEEA
ncbi:MAG: universal stress protein [Nitrosomonas sp.]|nr:universal stress protein [Nitrosomonas sp.]